MTTRYQSSGRRGLENGVENPKRTLRPRLKHIDVPSMPVYTSRIAVASNKSKIKSALRESLLFSHTSNKCDKTSDTNRDKAGEAGESPAVIEKKSENLINDISLRSKVDRATDSKYSCLSNTDSEDTLSNVESVPNSPAQETWPKVKGKNLNLNNKSLKYNGNKNIFHQRDTSWITNKIPACIDVSITETPCDVELKFISKRKRSETETSGTSKHDIEGNGSKLRYYVETSENENPFCTPGSSEKSGQNSGTGNDDLGGPQETLWLGKYEGPQKTHVETAENTGGFDDDQENSSQQNQDLRDQEKKDVDMPIEISDNTSIASNSHSNNSPGDGSGLSSRKRSGKFLQPSDKPSLRKRGRPRKRDIENSGINSGPYKQSGSSVNTAPFNGSGLTQSELERLFFKFSQDGHFRIDPGQSPIIIHDNNSYKNSSRRMQCYDPRKHHMHLTNMEDQSNSESETYLHLQQHFPNPNSRHFSEEHVGQTPFHYGMPNPFSTNTNIHSYAYSEKPATNTGNYAVIGLTNSVPNNNNLQSGYKTGFNYHQNYYNENANTMKNNSYSDIYSGAVNTYGVNAATASINLLSTLNDDQLSQDLSEIQDYMNQTSDNLGSCVNQSYAPTGSSDCGIGVELPNIRETEMSKLRQELVDFTRQYSEDQTISTSWIQQTEQVFI